MIVSLFRRVARSSTRRLFSEKTAAVQSMFEHDEDYQPKIFNFEEILQKVEEGEDQVKISEKDYPLKMDGFLNIKKLARDYDDLILDKEEGTKTLAEQKVQKVFRDYLLTLGDSSLKSLHENDTIEPTFKALVFKNLSKLKQVGATIEVIRNPENLEADNLKDEPNLQWLEVSHIKGARVERGNNAVSEVAVCNQENSFKGLVEFTFNVDIASKINHIMNYAKLEEEMILRAYCLVKTPYTIKVNFPNGDSVESQNKHLAVFENSLQRPPIGSEYLNEGTKYLQMYQLDKWYLTDVDGIFSGNQIFVPFDKRNERYVSSQGLYSYF